MSSTQLQRLFELQLFFYWSMTAGPKGKGECMSLNIPRIGDVARSNTGDYLLVNQITTKTNTKTMINSILVFSWIFAFYAMADQRPFGIKMHQSQHHN